ncbi:MAG: EAL domain-containing protein [Methylophaga sp.]|nr:EAL domain-containing protein [Methylophaga sp.]
MFFRDHSHIVSGTALSESYSFTLIIISILIAVLSSFTAFGTAERQYNSLRKSHKIAWNLFGAASMGLGIWAMHFIGMLALSLPVPIFYDVATTIISIIPVICACSIVLWMMAQQKYNIRRLVLGGMLLSSGIGLMHYIGMAGMRMNAVMVHDLSIFYLSLLVAIILAMVALRVSQQAAKYTHYQFITKRQITGAAVMGVATSAMHYIAMASVNFYPHQYEHDLSGISSSTLTSFVVGVAFLILSIAIAVPYFLRYKKMLGALGENVTRLSFALSAANQGWFDLNPQTGEVSVSDSYARLLGYTPEEFEPSIAGWRSSIHPEDLEPTVEAAKKNLRIDGALEYEYRRRTKQGSWLWLRSRGEVVEWDKENKPVRLIGIQTDITQRKEQQKELEKMAHYDVLTQLPNRTLFARRFAIAVEQSKANKSFLAICFLDLDNFKPVNDNYGHDVGDQLLIDVAARIRSHLRSEDTVSRQGGDEFTLLLSNLDSFEECERMLERIQASLAEPYLINNYPHKISASIGVTLYPNDNSDIDTLIRHADQAMYQAKISGRSRYHLFDVLDVQRTIEKQSQLTRIETALANNEFCLYYQPKVNMATGEVFGAEALVRWIHPEKGLLSPDEFLPVMEGSDLEIRFGNWVINQALQQLDEWQNTGLKLEVSINISSDHIQSELFLAQLDSALATWPKVDSHDLQIEILESSALSDLDAVSNVIHICRDVLGVSVALDDFGTSYSSLTHLRSLPAGIIKIDQSFVRDMLEDPSDCAIIEGVIALANSFNRKVIAEGVETIEQGEMLLLMGCNVAQGYYIAKPMPASEIPTWLNDYQVNQQWLAIGCRKELSEKQKRLKLFDLTVSSWHKRFLNNLKGTTDEIDYWPIMEKRKCPCGLWIRRETQVGLFDPMWLERLGDYHQQMHDLANELKKLYLNGKLELIEVKIETLTSIFEQLKDSVAEQA